MRVTRWARSYLDLPRIKCQPRLPELRALEGKLIYTYVDQPEPPHELYNILRRLFPRLEPRETFGIIKKKQLPNGRKLFKGLKDIGVEEATLQEWQNQLDSKTYPMHLTCAYKSLLRMSQTPHFSTCMSPGRTYGGGPVEIVDKHPEIAIVGCKDKAGDWKVRQLAYWSKRHDVLVLSPRVYPKRNLEPDFVRDPSVKIAVLCDPSEDGSYSFDDLPHFIYAYSDWCNCVNSYKILSPTVNP